MQPVPWEDSQIEQAELDNSFLALDRQQAQALEAGLGRLCLPCAWWWQGLLAAFLVLVVWLWGGVAYGSSALVGVLLAWVVFPWRPMLIRLPFGSGSFVYTAAGAPASIRSEALVSVVTKFVTDQANRPAELTRWKSPVFGL